MKHTYVRGADYQGEIIHKIVQTPIGFTQVNYIDNPYSRRNEKIGKHFCRDEGPFHVHGNTDRGEEADQVCGLDGEVFFFGIKICRLKFKCERTIVVKRQRIEARLFIGNLFIEVYRQPQPGLGKDEIRLCWWFEVRDDLTLGSTINEGDFQLVVPGIEDLPGAEVPEENESG